MFICVIAKPLSGYSAASLRYFDLPVRPAAGEVRAGDALAFSGELIGGAGGDDFAAAYAGAGAEIDQVVGGAHRLLVVLDHHDGIALVAQLAERGEQPVVVAGVQADRRFVEDVQHADQPAADLPGKPDPLQLAAGERRRGAVELQR